MALKVIKKGTLILSEKAQFKPKFEHEIDCLREGLCKPCLEKLMAAYHNMNSADQDEYLKLWNGIEKDQSEHHFFKEDISTMFPSSEVELVKSYLFENMSEDMISMYFPPKFEFLYSDFA